MPDLPKEREDLATAKRDIAEGERPIADQKALLAWMTERGQDTVEHEKLHRVSEETLQNGRIQQHLLLGALGQG
jgi:hypothetical protein